MMPCTISKLRLCWTSSRCAQVPYLKCRAAPTPLGLALQLLLMSTWLDWQLPWPRRPTMRRLTCDPLPRWTSLRQVFSDLGPLQGQAGGAGPEGMHWRVERIY